MRYVILETNTEGEDINNRLISEISYQIIDSQTLQPCNDPTILKISQETMCLEDSIAKLSKDINEYCNNGDKKNLVDESKKQNTEDKQFVFCTLDSNWDIRVSLVYSAKKQNLELPEYLRHPAIFDLRKEFSLWITNHPEEKKIKEHTYDGIASSTTISNNNMLSDLEVIIDSLNLNNEYANLLTRKGEPEFHVNLSRIILIKLHQSCITEEDELTVLTRPYDLAVDYHNFLEEKSKVLYINNIPSETTQNDLESWFNSYSLNPIGFWTLKDITDNVFLKLQRKDSTGTSSDNIFGFIIFRSHEEAKEGLHYHSNIFSTTNLKNNKCSQELIEIQPSSIRLLEKVQDNLVLFQQNKNKPRPGDWNCPSCGFSNFQRRIACFRCSFPIPNGVSGNLNKYHGLNSNSNSNAIKSYGANYNKPSNASFNWNNSNPSYQLNHQQQKQQQLQHLQHFQQTYQMYAANRASNNPQQFPLPNNYRYNYTTPQNNTGLFNNINEYSKLNQNIGNNSSAYVNISDQGQYSNNVSNNLLINNINTSNPNNSNTDISMNGGSNIPFRAGDWKCISCFYHNFAKNIVCLRCGGPKSLTDVKQSASINEKVLNNIEHRQQQNQHKNYNSKVFNTKDNGSFSNSLVEFDAAYPYLNAFTRRFNENSSEHLQERQKVPVSNL